MVSCTSQRTPSAVMKSTPESLGMSSQAIMDFIEAAERERPNDLHSFILMRHGKIAAQGWWNPYDSQNPHMLYSLSKSFTSTAIGMAQAEGLLTIDDPVISFFPEVTPADPSDHLKSMRIRDLLKMNSGHQQEPRSARQHEVSWIEGFLAAEVAHKPGTHFVYNSMATFMLSAIIQKVSGERLRDYLMPRLFAPLAIEEPTWDQNPNGIDYGGWGLYLRTEDIAKFGQLYLQKGNWKGRQLIPESWIRAATTYQTSNGSDPNSDWEQGYGYQFWMCRHGLYRGDGAFGQFCIVMPDQDAVLAITAGSSDMQALMNLAWDYLLPALKDKPLAPDHVAHRALEEKIASLHLDPAQGERTSARAKEISGTTYELEDNDWGLKSITFQLLNEASVIFTNADSSFTLPLGFGAYEMGSFDFPLVGKRSVAISAGWMGGDTLALKMYMCETPHGYNARATFDGDQMVLERELNVFFGGTKQKSIKGSAMN